jgi:hypothetical protein
MEEMSQQGPTQQSLVLTPECWKEGEKIDWPMTRPDAYRNKIGLQTTFWFDALSTLLAHPCFFHAYDVVRRADVNQT